MKAAMIALILMLAALCPPSIHADCKELATASAEWRAVDQQYAKLERAMLAKDAKALFALYSPDFEAHNINGSVWKFKDSAAYSSAGFEQVKENLHLNNTIIGMVSCAPGKVKATMLQQWSRMQESYGKVRRYETVTVQDETWVRIGDEWKRRLVDDIRPGAWYVDGKRVDPTEPYDPEAVSFDPHGLEPAATQK